MICAASSVFCVAVCAHMKRSPGRCGDNTQRIHPYHGGRAVGAADRVEPTKGLIS